MLSPWIPRIQLFRLWRSLGDLADASPVVLIDSREQTPLHFEHLESRLATLQSGDYSVLGVQESFAVERKTTQDLVACCIGDTLQEIEACLSHNNPGTAKQ